MGENFGAQVPVVDRPRRNAVRQARGLNCFCFFPEQISFSTRGAAFFQSPTPGYAIGAIRSPTLIGAYSSSSSPGPNGGLVVSQFWHRPMRCRFKISPGEPGYRALVEYTSGETSV